MHSLDSINRMDAHAEPAVYDATWNRVDGRNTAEDLLVFPHSCLHIPETLIEELDASGNPIKALPCLLRRGVDAPYSPLSPSNSYSIDISGQWTQTS